MHYYRHHIGDYRASTSGLSIAQHGAYRLLMDEYYVTGSALPADLASLYRICRAMNKEEKKAVAHVVATFFTVVDGRLSHQRIEEQLAEYQSQVETASRAGKASAAKRAGTRPPSVRRPLDSRCNPASTDAATERQPTTNHEPTTHDSSSKSTPKPPEGAGQDPGLHLEAGPPPQARAWNPSADMIRVADWFGRRPGTRWDDKELKAWRAIGPIEPADLAVMEARFLSTDRETARYRRQSLPTLLNNWTGELDLARKATGKEDDGRAF